MRSCLAVGLLLAATAAQAKPLRIVAFDIEPFELADTHELHDALGAGSGALRRALAERGLSLVSTAPKAAEIAAQEPLRDCVGCGRAIAQALGADLEVETSIQEIEYPIYNVFASVRDVATGRLLRKAVVSCEGLEDLERGATALVKERLLARPLPADADGLRELVAGMPAPVE